MNGVSFVNNIAAGVDVLGVENAPIIYALAKVKWDSVEDRDAAYAYLGGANGA